VTLPAVSEHALELVVPVLYSSPHK
jgi:hypothetical protein